MIFEQIRIQGDRNFSYLLGDLQSGQVALVDPGSEPERLARLTADRGLRLVYILNTHGHTDHTVGNETLRRLSGAKIAAFQEGDLPLSDGDRLALGDLEVRVIHTPGHTRESVCFLFAGRLCTGDTLFVGKVGGTSDRHTARLEYDSLHQKICTLPPETEVWPGHDYGVRPSSTVGDEIRTNPFLLRKSFEDFFDLKENWAEYKRIHGIA